MFPVIVIESIFFLHLLFNEVIVTIFTGEYNNSSVRL